MSSGFRDLEVWQASRELASHLYRLTESFLDAGRFGLTSQIRRAAVSVPSNIAEGYGRRQPKAYVQFLRIAKGSLNEIETLLILATDLQFCGDQPEIEQRINSIGMKRTNLIAIIESTPN